MAACSIPKISSHLEALSRFLSDFLEVKEDMDNFWKTSEKKLPCHEIKSHAGIFQVYFTIIYVAEYGALYGSNIYIYYIIYINDKWTISDGLN